MHRQCVEETRNKALTRALSRTAKGLGWAFIGLILTLGCAKQAQVEAKAEVFLPRHPFPQWVGKLKAGESNAESVMARFGSPDAIESRALGGQIWRYELNEIQWPEGDPSRPNISAQGEFKRRPATYVETAQSWAQSATGWFGRTFFFPPRQPRPAAIRRLPATVHTLELVFEVDELLSDFRYASGQGSAQVPAGG